VRPAARKVRNAQVHPHRVRVPALTRAMTDRLTASAIGRTRSPARALALQ
jgi:hypothetical protein